EHVATEHQVDSRKWRTLRQVMLSENDQATELLADFPRGVQAHQVAVAQLWQHVLQRGGGVDAAPRKGDGVAVQVRSKDANREVFQFRPEQVGNQDGKRVGLFASGAPGRPQSQFVASGARVLDEIWQDLLAQVREQVRVAEEIRDFDQEAVGESLGLVRM